MALIHTTSSLLALGLVLAAAPALAQEATPGHDQAVGQQFHITADSLPEPNTSPSLEPRAQLRSPAATACPSFRPAFPSPSTSRASCPRAGSSSIPTALSIWSSRVPAVSSACATSTATISPTRAASSSRGAANPFGLAFVPDGAFKGDLLLTDQDGMLRLPMVSAGCRRRADHAARRLSASPPATSPASSPSIRRPAPPISPSARSPISPRSRRSRPPSSASMLDGTNQQTFATGLRNTTGLAFDPATGALYGVVMERDGMGDESRARLF